LVERTGFGGRVLEEGVAEPCALDEPGRDVRDTERGAGDPCAVPEVVDKDGCRRLRCRVDSVAGRTRHAVGGNGSDLHVVIDLRLAAEQGGADVDYSKDVGLEDLPPCHRVVRPKRSEVADTRTVDDKSELAVHACVRQGCYDRVVVAYVRRDGE